MARTGIPRIDNLFEGREGQPIGPADPDREAVGVMQDFLIGHGFADLPGPLRGDRGIFGPRTTAAVKKFQQDHNLNGSGAVDRATLESLVTVPPVRPLASRGYLSLVLDFSFTGMTRVMSLTTQFEGAGLFTALNRNTDRAGLSFGLIQWAQKPGRLNEIVRAFQAQEPQAFVQVLGGGDPALAQGLIDHTAKPRGGTQADGRTTDPRFDLVAEPWVSRFIEAGRTRELQRVQVQAALKAFDASFRQLQAFAPQIRSERGVAFMLDLANQHGDGGASSIFRAAEQPGLSEPELLARIQDESVARVRRQFGDGPETRSTQNRREAFRSSALLSDEPFSTA